MPTNIGNSKAKLYLGDIEISGGGSSLLDNTITFKSDNVDYAINSVASGNTIQAPTQPTKSGNVFKGWENSSQQVVTFPYTPTLASEDLNAKWQPASKAIVSGLGSLSPSSVTFNVDASFDFNFEEVTKDGNVFIKIPTMYRKVNSSNNGQITGYTLSNAKLDDTYEPYPCFVKEDGTSVMDYILIGKYMSSSTTVMNSVNARFASQTIGNARTNVNQMDAGYQLYDWQIHKLFQDLVCCFKKTINTNDGTGFDEILGIAHQKNGFWIDGVAAPSSGNNWLFSEKPSKYIDQPSSSSDGYYQVNYARPTSDGEVSALGYDTTHPFANYPKSVTSNSRYNTYYCDAYYYSSGSRPVYCVVGDADAYRGVFRCYTGYDWSYADGVRLCFRPL